MCAGVVTFRSPPNLAACLDALAAQGHAVDRVVIVDNGGDAAVAELVAQSPLATRVDLVVPGENLGPAGGFARALERFLDSDAEFAWLLDDDVTPEPSCLGVLLRVAEQRADGVLVAPALVEHGSRAPVSVWGWHGVLVPRSYVEIAGLPIAELFWGLEDTEYLFFRPPAHGYHAIIADGALAAVNLRREHGSRAAWKYYYLARNAVFLNLYRRPGVGWVPRAKRLVYRLGHIAALLAHDEGHRPSKAVLLGHGIVDGARRRLGRRVPVVDADRPAAP